MTQCAIVDQKMHFEYGEDSVRIAVPQDPPHFLISSFSLLHIVIFHYVNQKYRVSHQSPDATYYLTP